MKIRFLAFIAGLALAACDSTSEPAETPEVRSAQVVASDVPVIRHLDVTLERAAHIEVVYWASGRPKLRVSTSEPSKQHRIFLPRLYAGSAYTYEVRSVNEAGEKSEARTGEFDTGDLPADIAALQLNATGSPTEPLTMIELMITNNGVNGALIADESGEIVWYWRTETWINGLVRRENGNFVFLDNDSGLVEMRPDLEIVRRLRNGPNMAYGLIHHDLTVSPQNTILFLARENRVIRDTTIVGEAIWEWIPETNQVVKKWSVFDHFNWDTERGSGSAPNNWLHANSITMGQRGNVIVSARNMDQVFSISPDFQRVEWRLGGPGETIAPLDADRFYGQHSAFEVAPNRVLLFDNGITRPASDGWSRALELEVDVTNRRAAKLWEFRPAPDNNAVRVGSAVRLANGNTVASFGWGQGSPIVVYEVTPAGSIVWQMTANEQFNRVYRMRPMADIAGEAEVN